MAVIAPTDLPPGDLRPIYSRDRLPGGPWNQFRPREWVNARLVTGAFLLVRPDGMLVERTGPVWVVHDPNTGDLQVLDPGEFSTAYQPQDT